MITDKEKIERFDKAHKVLFDRSFRAPEIRPADSFTVDLITDILCNGR